MRESLNFIGKHSPPWLIPWPRTISLIVGSFMATFLLAFIYRIPNDKLEAMVASKRMETAGTIGSALDKFAHDHGGNYPKGQSSTDVFQQLIDQKYVSDPTLFYLPMAGKTKPQGTQLAPKNVSWDVTNAVRSDDSDYLPIVFSTGYKIHYRLLGNAMPLTTTVPGEFLVLRDKGGMAYMRSSIAKGIVKDAVISLFDPKGRTYQQLTPDGPLP